mgnify:CR=1 FL=1
MKEMGGIGRWALILLLLGNVYGGFAQDANTARAQHIYGNCLWQGKVTASMRH